MIFKDDVIQALEQYTNYHKRMDNYYDDETFINHFCKKFSYPKTRYKKVLRKIYLEYMEENNK